MMSKNNKNIKQKCNTKTTGLLIIKKLKKYWLFLCYVPVSMFFCIPYPVDNNPYSTIIEASDGELLGAVIASDGQWRFPADKTLSETYLAALTLFEDKRFYVHQGVDIVAILRALRQNIKTGKASEGGSSITMQTVRLMRKGRRRTLTEKIIEMVLALKLEAQFGKREILALYAANAPFGGNVVGVETAAWRYFGRKARDLSWAEAATLAVLPNAPSLIHPGRNRNRLKNKRDHLLNRLHSKNIVNAETLALAKTEPLPDSPLPLPRSAPHLLDKITAISKGQRVRTTILHSLQQSVTAIVENHVRNNKRNRVNNAAVIVAEIQSGNVLAYVGNAMQDNELHGANVDVVTAPRSTGSILKPFLYAAMLDDGELLPNTLVPDVPMNISGFAPHNFDKLFNGSVSAHDALTRSLNVPSVRMLADYNVEKFRTLLVDLGMTTLSKSAGHYGLSLILGGAEGTLWDIAGMYADLARVVNNFGRNSGRYSSLDRKKLNCIAEISPKKEEARYSKTGLIGAAACWQTLETLSELNRPEEESSWHIFSSGRRVAWKTGTSYGNRDAWAIGTTPEYLVGVWVGNASGEGRPLLTGVGYAAPLLFDVFNLLPRSTEWFKQPYDEMVRTAVCCASGHRAGEFCAAVDTVWITETGLLSSVCPYHRLIHLDKNEKYRVNSACYPVHEIVHRKWFVLPPAQEWFYRKYHLDYRPLPPFAPDCTIDESSPMQMIYPTHGIAVVPTRQIDGEKGKIIFQAAHNRNNAIIYWHIDDRYLGSTDGSHQLALLPDEGAHVLTLVDNEGYSLIMPFVVK
ncbi:MAG: penicillin-binding protein 1C [Prevotellaceae bacterium]|jgi:penicillin-binding protein 1C|nr:penicillin-binding protein 1C [Prevotellaceae bacterium]